MGWVQGAPSSEAGPECPPAALSTEPSGFWHGHRAGVRRMRWRVGVVTG